jgi:hypothetical protein
LQISRLKSNQNNILDCLQLIPYVKEITEGEDKLMQSPFLTWYIDDSGKPELECSTSSHDGGGIPLPPPT